MLSLSRLEDITISNTITITNTNTNTISIVFTISKSMRALSYVALMHVCTC